MSPYTSSSMVRSDSWLERGFCQVSLSILMLASKGKEGRILANGQETSARSLLFAYAAF